MIFQMGYKEPELKEELKHIPINKKIKAEPKELNFARNDAPKNLVLQAPKKGSLGKVTPKPVYNEENVLVPAVKDACMLWSFPDRKGDETEKRGLGKAVLAVAHFAERFYERHPDMRKKYPVRDLLLDLGTYSENYFRKKSIGLSDNTIGPFNAAKAAIRELQDFPEFNKLSKKEKQDIFKRMTTTLAE